MKNTGLRDLQEMVARLRYEGHVGTDYELHVPVNYARLLRTELLAHGHQLAEPDAGTELLLEINMPRAGEVVRVTMLVQEPLPM